LFILGIINCIWIYAHIYLFTQIIDTVIEWYNTYNRYIFDVNVYVNISLIFIIYIIIKIIWAPTLLHNISKYIGTIPSIFDILNTVYILSPKYSYKSVISFCIILNTNLNDNVILIINIY